MEMAEFDKYAPKLLRVECAWSGGFPTSWDHIEALFEKARKGAYVNNPHDNGGPTFAGVTLAVYRHFYGTHMSVNDLRHMAYHEWRNIYKAGYWDVMKADQIKNQSIADICVDWLVNSGVARVRDIQKIVGVTADGLVGPKTISAINSGCPMCTHARIKDARKAFFDQIIANNPSQAVFRNGWLNRLGYFDFKI